MAENRLPNGSRHEAVKLLVGYDKEVAAWVGGKLEIDNFGESSAIGVVKEDKIVAGAVYFSYRPPSVEIAFASTTPKWCTRAVIKQLLWYPFGVLRCGRVTALIHTDNQKASNFAERLGFVCEGTMREASKKGDLAVYGMIKTDCRWI